MGRKGAVPHAHGVLREGGSGGPTAIYSIGIIGVFAKEIILIIILLKGAVLAGSTLARGGYVIPSCRSEDGRGCFFTFRERIFFKAEGENWTALGMFPCGLLFTADF